MTQPSPFIWFGGKRRVAALIWDALGDVDNYVEPFIGSGAVLLARPETHAARCETVNDADMFLSNFWRALAADPDGVARWADWPVNECDLFARHLWLVNDGRALLAKHLEQDPDWHDAKVAGWWVWGLNSWIGSGWCSGKGPWKRAEDTGAGVNRKLPHLGDAGQGINRQDTPADLIAYFRFLAARLRRVRVCCGDWARVVTPGAMTYGATVGVFLDPPYDPGIRAKGVYAVDDDSGGLAVAVREWAITHGADRRLRIVLAGYESEHADEMATAGWRVHAYAATAAYQTAAQAGGSAGNQANRRMERMWFSPHCLVRQDPLPWGEPDLAPESQQDPALDPEP